ncbi:hypothetical protein SAMN05660845_1956 [Flavobacterium swingsii]|jgi:hypothetical protein|uniref:Uncharacterized protein n=1 Tax=Flavobacterium swingsii TaxID=498292 RepID=A0A1I0Z4C0_9FLAO|nr:hypothetical protein SAMN05660845_1956 [Flavobacterium swingsii]
MFKNQYISNNLNINLKKHMGFLNFGIYFAKFEFITIKKINYGIIFVY